MCECRQSTMRICGELTQDLQGAATGRSSKYRTASEPLQPIKGCTTWSRYVHRILQLQTSRATHKNQMPFRISYIIGVFFLFKHFNWMIVSKNIVHPASHVLKDRLSPASSEVENDQEKTEEILGSRHRQGPGWTVREFLLGWLFWGPTSLL